MSHLRVWMYLINECLVYKRTYFKSDLCWWSNNFLHKEIQLFLTLTDTMSRFKGHFYKWVTWPNLLPVRPFTNGCRSKYKKDIWSHKEIHRSWWVQPLNRTICPPFSLIDLTTCGRIVWKDITCSLDRNQIRPIQISMQSWIWHVYLYIYREVR